MPTAAHNKKHFLAFGLAVFLFLMLCIPAVMFAQPNPGPTTDGLVPCNGPECDFDDLVTLIQNIINFLLYTVAVPVATLLFMWAGFKYLTAGGDPGKVKAAHSIFMNVFIGFLIALGAWLVVNLLAQTLLKEPTLFI